jgi:hypothetical protein
MFPLERDTCHPLMGPRVIFALPHVTPPCHIFSCPISMWSTWDPPVLAYAFNTPSRVRVDPLGVWDFVTQKVWGVVS